MSHHSAVGVDRRPRVAAADLTFEDLLSHGRIERPDLRSFDEDEIAELFYTSGSTGSPKGVMLSHRTLYLHALAVAGAFNHDDNAVELHTIPLFHANGWGRPQTAVMNGLKQVMVSRFDPAQVLRLIQDEGATAMSLVPTMANSLLNCAGSGQVRHLQPAGDSHRRRGCRARADRADGGGIPLQGDGRLRPHRDLPRGDFGAAQGHRPVCLRRGPCPPYGYGRLALPGCEIRVVDLHMQDVPRDMQTIGEVVIRGDNVMDGYFKEPEATAAVMSGGLAAYRRYGGVG